MLENPGAREMACIMETSMAAGKRCIFSVNADIGGSWCVNRTGESKLAEHLPSFCHLVEQTGRVWCGVSGLLVEQINGLDW